MINFFKKTLLLLTLSGVAVTASAQDSGSASTFDPYWSVSVQGGIGATIGELSFSDLMAPAAAISGAYRFSPVFGARAGFSGWNGRGNIVRLDNSYNFNYVQMNFDLTLDVINIFADYKSTRLVNPYVFAGFGINYAFNNDEAVTYYEYGYMLENIWYDKQVLLAGRAGVGVDFRISNTVSVGLEANTNLMSDKFNSKDRSNPDWQYNMLAGVTVNFGKEKPVEEVAPVEEPKPKAEPKPKSKAAKAAAEKAAAEAVAADKAAAEKAAADKVAAERRAAAKKAAAEKAKKEAAEKAAAEKAAAEKAAAQKEAAAKAPKSAYFELNSDKVNDSDVDEVVALMNEYPDRKIVVAGYADAATGNSRYNMALSKRRADNFKAALVKKGVAADRISVEYKGDSVQPYSVNDKNRAVISTLE